MPNYAPHIVRTLREVYSAAKVLAAKDLRGNKGDNLPSLMSSQAVHWVNHHPSQFRAMVCRALYRQAQQADNAFSAECTRQFGRLAGDMRYHNSAHDERTRAARDKYKSAMAAYLAACTAARSVNP